MGYAVLSVCTTWCMLYMAWTHDRDMESQRGMSQLYVLRWWWSARWERETWEEFGNHQERLGLKRMFWAGQFTIPDTAAMTSDTAAMTSDTARLAKCIIASWRLWVCLGVVGPESQRSQIPELTGPMQLSLGAPGSTCDYRWQAWGHLGLL